MCRQKTIEKMHMKSFYAIDTETTGFDFNHPIQIAAVLFVDGKPRPSEYRSFRVRSVGEGRSDDFASMREVVVRRYRRRIEENGSLPDLLVVDGGKGQLSSAVEALRELDLYGRFPVVGLAKRLEEVFLPGDSDSRQIAKASARVPLGAMATPDEIADVAVFLCSEQARHITGQTIQVNGGTNFS